MLDYHVHLIGHQDRPANEQSIREYLDQANEKGLREIGFSDHNRFLDELNLSLIKEVAKEYPDLKVRVGLEMDYWLDEEEKITEVISRYPFDYVIGSVHDLDGWLFDFADQEAKHHEWDPDKLYEEYFYRVERAAASGLYNTIGHLDLIKIFGVRPRRDILQLADAALTKIAEQGMVVELNTAGKYKPVGEYYPEAKLIKEIKRRGIPMTLGSDAHQPLHVARDLDLAAKMLKDLEITELVGFLDREKITYSL